MATKRETVYTDRNRGVEARAACDKIAFEAEQITASDIHAKLQAKAERYSQMSKFLPIFAVLMFLVQKVSRLEAIENDDMDDRSSLVDFEAKMFTESNELLSEDMRREAQRRRWEYEQEDTLAKEEAERAERLARSEQAEKLSEATAMERQRLLAIKAQRAQAHQQRMEAIRAKQRQTEQDREVLSKDRPAISLTFSRPKRTILPSE